MSEVRLLNINQYSSYFLTKNKSLDIKYDNASTDYDYYDTVAELGGNNLLVDTPLEIALLSYSAGVIDARPVEAKEMLPANDPRTAGLKLGAATLKELTELKFLDPQNTAAIGRYEGMLKFISDKNGVSRAEIDNYYRQGIRSLIAEAVDEEFNKISFFIDKSKTGSSYGAVLTHNAKTGHYTLDYEGYFNGAISTKTLSAPTLRELQTKMSTNKTDFDEADIRTVSDKAAQIPAAVLNDISLNDIEVIITNSYTNPKQETYGYLVDISALYSRMWISSGGNRLFEFIGNSYNNTLGALNEKLAAKVYRDAHNARSVAFLSGEQQENLVSLQDD
jgi:hypothetical protein